MLKIWTPTCRMKGVEVVRLRRHATRFNPQMLVVALSQCVSNSPTLRPNHARHIIPTRIPPHFPCIEIIQKLVVARCARKELQDRLTTAEAPMCRAIGPMKVNTATPIKSIGLMHKLG